MRINVLDLNFFTIYISVKSTFGFVVDVTPL